MAETSTPPIAAVEWRRLTAVLWVGRRDDRHVGMVEHGHDFVATDDEGVVRGRFRRLADAQASFDAPRADDADTVSSEPAEAWRRRRIWPFVTAGGVVALAAVGTTAAMLLH